MESIPTGYLVYLLVAGGLGLFGAFKVFHLLGRSISGLWVFLIWLLLFPIGFAIAIIAEGQQLFYGLLFVYPIFPFVLIGAAIGAVGGAGERPL